MFGKKQAFEMGKLRQQEAVEAMKYLGLHEDQQVFLGYPDYGTLNIFRKYWKARKPYRGVLTRVTRVPYSTSLTVGAAYEASNILNDFKNVLLDFKPTKIFVTHPADSNADHQAAYLFLKIALWDLQGQLKGVSVYSFFVHATNWPRPTGLHAQLRLDPLTDLRFQGNQWVDFELSPEQIQRKQETIQYYRTQIPYKPKFLYTFVRANELFSAISEVELEPQVMDLKSWAQCS